MKAIAMTSAGGGLGALEILDLPPPTPAPGEVLIRVGGVALNPADHKMIARGHPAWRFPQVVGLDTAGVVVKVGAEADRVWIGRRVFVHASAAALGAFAEYCVAPAHVLGPSPANLDDATAATLGCAGLTAHQGLTRRLRPRPGEQVLVRGAGGAVGIFAVGIALAMGARVHAIGSAERGEAVLGLGAACFVDHRDPSAFDLLRRQVGDTGFDAIVDCVGGPDTKLAMSLLGYGGQMVCIAGVPELKPAIGRRSMPPDDFPRGRGVQDISLGGVYDEPVTRQVDLGRMAAELSGLVETGRVTPPEVIRVDFGEIPRVLREMASGASVGKVVAEVGGGGLG
jgi:NADPH:quinone reductase